MMEGKEVTIIPPSPLEIERVAKALYAARGIKHPGAISPWSRRLNDDAGERARGIWEGLAIAAIDMVNGCAARL